MKSSPPIRFGSVCSGIEAASVAWHPLGWRAAWLAEIEPYPRTVLAHHYPDVPNLGDMTLVAAMVRAGLIEAPNVFTGGTPCQAFSVAGLRRSLDDARGNLSLTFCEIANAIDTVRADRGEDPATIVWENVPGVLSTKDNAFGCFLAGLAGEDDPLEAPGGKWRNAGVVLGPQRTVAWRVLDAQYFGVAQRRRRVFVIASARKGFDPVSVLFEFDGVRRDSAPSREAGKVAPTIPARSLGGGGLGTDFDCDGGLVRVDQPLRLRCGCDYEFDDRLGAFGCPNCEGDEGPAEPISAVICMAHGQGGSEVRDAGGAEVRDDGGASCLTCNHEAPIVAIPATAHTLRGEGFDASEDGTGRGTPLVPSVQYAYYSHDYANDRITDPAGVNPALTACSTGTGNLNVLAPVSFAIQAGALRTNPNSGPDGIGVQADHAYTLEARAEVQAVAFTQSQRDEVRTLGVASVQGPFRFGDHQQDTIHHESGVMSTLPGGSNRNAGHFTTTVSAMQVRRLTPRECERLQGFQFRVAPDYPGAWEDGPGEWWSPDYTLIPGKARKINPAKLDRDYVKYLARGGRMSFDECCQAAADGPRYKALGNSWAVPNVRWIGRRIAAELARSDAESDCDTSQTRADT